MGKNKRRTFDIEDTVHNTVIQADSIEEVDFVKWLCEAYELGIIIDFIYQPTPFQLIDGIDIINVAGKKRALFRQHIYTSDFKIIFDAIKYKNLALEFKIPVNKITEQFEQYIDVKGTFSRSDGGRSFSINQKWVYSKFGVYIYKLVPQDFFKLFGVPEKCKLTEKTKKPSKKYARYTDLKEVQF